MRGKRFAASLLAALGVLAWSDASRGGDTIRLNMVENTPTKNLVDDGQGADTVRTWHRGFGWGGYGGWGYRGLGWGGWGYRGLGWGGYGGWGWGGLGYRGLGWGGFYRPYYGLGMYRPLYGFGLGYGLGLGGFGYGLGYGGLGYGYGLGYGGLFWPCAGIRAGVYTLNVPATTLGSAPVGSVPSGDGTVPPPMPNSEGTFPYDGGPQQVVPNPKDTPSSLPAPRSVPMEGRSVSLPRAKPKWTYPAYGEIARRTPAAPERTFLTRVESKKSNSR